MTQYCSILILHQADTQHHCAFVFNIFKHCFRIFLNINKFCFCSLMEHFFNRYISVIKHSFFLSFRTVILHS